MWDKIKPVLAQIFSSRKALALIAGAVIWALAQAKIVATPDQILPLLGLVSAYLLGQGIADHGKGAVEAAKKLSPADHE